MPQVGIKYAGINYTWDEAREASADPSFPYPLALVEAMADQRGDTQPSASSIVGCLRRFELQRKMNYFDEANGQLPPLFGTAWHSLMEMYTERIKRAGDLIEKRLSKTFRFDRGNSAYSEVEFSGKLDFFRPGQFIMDWKSKRHIPQGFVPTQENTRQANIYNWLAAVNGYEAAPNVELVYVTQGWVQREVFRATPLDVVEDFVTRRLTRWVEAARSGSLPPPVPELFGEPDRYGKLPAPCGYCPVREQCLAAIKSEEARPF